MTSEGIPRDPMTLSNIEHQHESSMQIMRTLLDGMKLLTVADIIPQRIETIGTLGQKMADQMHVMADRRAAMASQMQAMASLSAGFGNAMNEVVAWMKPPRIDIA